MNNEERLEIRKKVSMTLWPTAKGDAYLVHMNEKIRDLNSWEQKDKDAFEILTFIQDEHVIIKDNMPLNMWYDIVKRDYEHQYECTLNCYDVFVELITDGFISLAITIWG